MAELAPSAPVQPSRPRRPAAAGSSRGRRGRNLPSPSATNFLAGLFAGAGINMLTSVATSPGGGDGTRWIVLDSALWVAAAGCLTWVAHVIGDAELAANRKMHPDLDAHENEGIRRDELAAAAARVRLPAGTAVVLTVGALVLVPNMINWPELLALVRAPWLATMIVLSQMTTVV